MNRMIFIGMRLLVVVFLISQASMASALEPTDKWEGVIDYAATGGSFLIDTCIPLTTGDCAPPSALIPLDGQGDTVVNQSAAFLNGIPEGVHLVKSYLIWMGSIQHNAMQADSQVTLTPPGGKNYLIVAPSETLDEIVFEGNDPVTTLPATYHFYTYRVDITETMKRHHVTEGLPIVGEYIVSGFDGYAGSPYKMNTTVLGGWSLINIYSIPDGEPRRIYYYTDFQMIQDQVVSLTPSGFEVPEDPQAKITFFLGEGDLGIAGMGLTGSHNEELNFNGQILSDSCNTMDNAYNSTINTNIHPSENPCRINQYSVDLDTFTIGHLLNQGDTTANIGLTLGQDMAFSNFLILSIKTKLPDFDIPNEPEKDASVPSGSALNPGQQFIYYIFVENNGEDVAENVRVRDELPPEVEYLPSSTVVVEPSGNRRVVADPPSGTPPCFTGITITDQMPPGPAFRHTVEIGVRLKTQEQGVTKESIINNVGEIISGNGDVYFTNGGIPASHTVQLESFEGELHFNKGRKHPGGRFVAPGEQDVLAAHINLKAKDDNVRISSFKFTPMVDTDALSISSASLYWDKNGDGAIGQFDSMLGDEQSWSGGGLVFSDFSLMPQINANQQADLILLVDIAEDALPGSIAQLELTDESVTIGGFVYGLPFSCARIMLPDASTDLSMELGEANPPDGYVAQGASEVLMQLKLRAYSPSVVLSGLILATEGTIYDPTEIQSITLIKDTNGNGLMDGAEPQMGLEFVPSTDDAPVIFSDLALAVPEGGQVNLNVVVTFFESVGLDKTFRLTINNNDQLEAGGMGVAGAPVVGSLFTIADQVQECRSDEECTGELGQGWACDFMSGICTFVGGIGDGDYPDVADGDDGGIDGDAFDDGSGQDGEGAGGGCSLPTNDVASGLLILLLLATLLARRLRSEEA